jgi:hypothetical protein
MKLPHEHFARARTDGKSITHIIERATDYLTRLTVAFYARLIRDSIELRAASTHAWRRSFVRHRSEGHDTVFYHSAASDRPTVHI